MKKSILLFIILICQSFVFAKDFNCTFVYKVATTSGVGSCSEGKDPIVKIDLENKIITFPDFVFTKSKTIPEYSVEQIKINTNQNGVIEVSKENFQVNQNGKTIIGKKLKGTIDGDQLNLDVTLKVGKMPFDLKVKYFTQNKI